MPGYLLKYNVTEGIKQRFSELFGSVRGVRLPKLDPGRAITLIH